MYIEGVSRSDSKTCHNKCLLLQTELGMRVVYSVLDVLSLLTCSPKGFR